jgi:TfuA protein
MPARPVVFLGPSLTHAEAEQELPDGIFLPPIKRGSLLPFLDDVPPAIGIIDGEFFQSFAVSTQEILLFLERGVPVFGSSSIGALRAVELEAHGMIGIGRIFEMFRDGRLDADDEVAMTFCPETLRALSEPMVNFRIALDESCRQGVLSRRESAQLSARLKAVYFPDRTLPRFFQEVHDTLPPERVIEVREWWRRSSPNAKADDARSLLHLIRSARFQISCSGCRTVPTQES